MGAEYPAKPPAVVALTTNGGRTRFNPNIYAGGKVCLSILGTWRAGRGEEWSSAQGIESILLSIQSLMSSNPYENEPGFETTRSDTDKQAQKSYASKIRHESLRISVITRLEEFLAVDIPDRTAVVSSTDRTPVPVGEVVDDKSTRYDPFKELCKHRFLWYYESYLAAIDTHGKETTANQPFKRTGFEGGGNGMDGSFKYAELRQRLMNIRKALDIEMRGWIIEGAQAVKDEKLIAASLQRQFEQAVETYSADESVTISLELVNGNPFLWQMIYYGRPMTNLDGGMFKIRLYFSTRFPDELARVRFETPLFHHRISKDGVPCLLPEATDEAKYYVEAVITLLEDEDPPYDPRTVVNPEATKLLWGSKEEKKEYSRRLRRAVSRSIEYE